MNHRRTRQISDYATTFVFLALAAYFLIEPVEPNWPQRPPQLIAAEALPRGPLRTQALLTSPPQALINGFVRDCNDCHSLMQPPVEAARRLTQHTHLVLDHGMNDRCFNCHAREDRNRLALRGSETVGFDQVELLCAQCHGPTYRDWERGVHGKSLGSWIVGSAARVRLTCVQCHDPHAPRYAPMQPLPAPSTLRMGPQDPDGAHGHETEENPLRRYPPEEDWPYEPVRIGVEEEPTPYDSHAAPEKSPAAGEDEH